MWNGVPTKIEWTIKFECGKVKINYLKMDKFMQLKKSVQTNNQKLTNIQQRYGKHTVIQN